MNKKFKVIADYKRFEKQGDPDKWVVFQKMIESYIADGRLGPTNYPEIGCIFEMVTDHVNSTHGSKRILE